MAPPGPPGRPGPAPFHLSNENLLEPAESGMPPPLPPLKPEWRHLSSLTSSNNTSGEAGQEEEEQALPSDSLYGQAEPGGAGSWRHRRPGPRPALQEMAHWSSHGYLAKEEQAGPDRGSGYVVLKRQGEAMVTARSSPSQPTSLPPAPAVHQENKYFSVRGMRDFKNKVNDNFGSENEKYFSVDAKFLSQHADMKLKLQENLKVAPQQTQNSGKPLPELPQYYQPPPPVYQRPPAPRAGPPAPPARVSTKPGQVTGSLEASKAMSGSVSWLEWTQQLQAYVAWVNSQLRKREGLLPVQDLRSDLQSGEVLAQLIEIICE